MEKTPEMIQAIMEAATGALKAAVKAMSEAVYLVERNNVPVSAPNMSTRSSGTVLTQPTLNW